MVHPLHIPYGSSSDGSDPVVISPESAGWGFAGLRIIELPAGGSRTLHTGADEMLVLPLSGSASVTCDGSTFELVGRADVFSGPSDFAYLPIRTELTLSTTTGGRFALPSAGHPCATPGLRFGGNRPRGVARCGPGFTSAQQFL